MALVIKKYFLIAIVLVALLLRVYNLENLPSGFHNDEASFFYNALVLRDTGKDEDGRSWPLYLNSFIDPKPALFSYFQIPFTWIWGDTTTAARLPSVTFGVGSIVLVYFLLKRINISESVSLLITTLMVVSPWHIMASRATQEVIMSFFFGLLSLLTLLILINEHQNPIETLSPSTLAPTKNRAFAWLKKLSQMYGSISFLRQIGLISAFAVTTLLSLYSYHSAKVALPLLILVTLFSFPFRQHRRLLYSIGVMGILIVSFWVTTVFTTGGLARFNSVSIFKENRPFLILQEQTMVATPYEPLVIIRFFHNKVVNFSLAISQGYFEHFSANFLFFSGGAPSRYQIPFHGLLFHIEIVLIVLGIVNTFNNRSTQKWSGFFIAWLLISPLAASITTQEVPSTIRAFFMIVPLMFFAAYGIITIWTLSPLWLRRVGQLIVVSGYMWGLLYFGNQFIIQQPHYHPWQRHYDHQAMASELEKIQSNYNHIYISDQSQPYIYLALAKLISPQELQTSYPARTQRDFAIGKYLLSAGECPLGEEENALYVVRKTCEYSGDSYSIVGKAPFLDGADGYLFLTWHEPATVSAVIKKPS